MAMLRGTLRLKNSALVVGADEEVYNGAVYTNWGFGVPLLELPFHFFARHAPSFKNGFFPDRAIFFAYLSASAAIAWIALNRLLRVRLAGRSHWLRRLVLSGTAVTCFLTAAVFPLMAGRFIVYEETVAYFVLVELVALSAYVYVLEGDATWPVVALGVAAALGLLVRVTGLAYFGTWGVLAWLARREKSRTAVAFAAGAAPLVAFWLFTNWVKAGNPYAFGYQNSMAYFSFDTHMQRFGIAPCADSVGHAWQVVKQLFEWFFDPIAEEKPETDDRSEFLRQCRFTTEREPTKSPLEPFFGLPVLVFLIVTLAAHLVRKDRRAAAYLPYATLLFVFLQYLRGWGFTWRYCGDFWPLVALVAVHSVWFLPSAADRYLGLPLALAFAACTRGKFLDEVKPEIGSIRKIDPGGEPGIAAEFDRYYLEDRGPMPPSRVQCGKVARGIYHNGLGWNDDCTVDTASNFFIGVPKKATDDYELRFTTRGITSPTLRVYLNGRIYTASRRGDDEYVAPVQVRYCALHQPMLMGAIEWTRAFDPPTGKLLAVELT